MGPMLPASAEMSMPMPLPRLVSCPVMKLLATLVSVPPPTTRMPVHRAGHVVVRDADADVALDRGQLDAEVVARGVAGFYEDAVLPAQDNGILHAETMNEISA
jgi:hypothetical protein